MSYQDAILLTGGSTGIGWHCAKELAAARPSSLVVIASRKRPTSPLPANTTFHPLDLASRASVRALVANWSFPALSTLIFNAGMIPTGKPAFTDHGVELAFEVNTVGHALLLFLLAQRGLVRSDASIVFVTTALHDPEWPAGVMRPHWTSAAGVARAEGREMLDPGCRYSTAKLGGILFAYALDERVQRAGAATASPPAQQGGEGDGLKHWRVNVFEPGWVPTGTDLGRDGMSSLTRSLTTLLIPLLVRYFRRKGIVDSTPARSGRLMAQLALGEIFGEQHGAYVLLDKMRKSSRDTYRRDRQDDVWGWVVGEVAEGEVEREAFGAI